MDFEIDLTFDIGNLKLNTMSFKKIILSIFTAVLLLAPSFVLAQYGLEAAGEAAKLPGASGGPASVAGATNIIQLIGAIIGIALSLIGVIFFILILYAGGVWMTAAGNSERVSKAKELLETASIGLVIVLAAYAIANFVFTNLDVK